MKDKTVILCPTGSEAVCFAGTLPEGIPVVIGGVGMAATAAAVTRILAGGRPRRLILAGIAGAYPSSGLEVGDCVLVGTERVADQGAFRDGRFKPLYAEGYSCPYAEEAARKFAAAENGAAGALPVVQGCTVNAAANGFADFADGAVESMEGAVFFAVCAAAGIPFLEVRAVSNLTTASRGEWRMDLAARALADTLKILLEHENHA